jgi:hypothetical protein
LLRLIGAAGDRGDGGGFFFEAARAVLLEAGGAGLFLEAAGAGLFLVEAEEDAEGEAAGEADEEADEEAAALAALFAEAARPHLQALPTMPLSSFWAIKPAIVGGEGASGGGGVAASHRGAITGVDGGVSTMGS